MNAESDASKSQCRVFHVLAARLVLPTCLVSTDYVCLRTMSTDCLLTVYYCVYSGNRPDVEEGGRRSGIVRRNLGQGLLRHTAEPEREVRGGPQEGDQEVAGEFLQAVGVSSLARVSRFRACWCTEHALQLCGWKRLLGMLLEMPWPPTCCLST